MYKSKTGQAAKLEYSTFEQMDLKYFNRAITVVESGIDLGIVPASLQTGAKLAELLNAILSEEEYNRSSQDTRDMATYLLDNESSIVSGFDPRLDRLSVGPDKLGVGIRVTLTMGRMIPLGLRRLFTPKIKSAPRFW